MIQPQVFDLDQARILDADAAHEQLYFDGIDDGFEGRKPVSIELDYLKGYGEGTNRFLSVLKCETALLTGMESQIQALLDEPF